MKPFQDKIDVLFQSHRTTMITKDAQTFHMVQQTVPRQRTNQSHGYAF